MVDDFVGDDKVGGGGVMGGLLHASGRRRPSSWVLRLLLAGGAFALGCLPSARLVTRRAAGLSIEGLGDGNPGAANVRRSLGLRPALAVAALDIGKGWLPPLLGRRLGADDAMVGMLGFAPVAGHVFGLRGRGAASALGAGLGMDFWAMASAGLFIIAGTIKRVHAPAVLLGVFITPLFSIMFGRSRPRVLWSMMTMSLLIVSRLRGPRRGALPLSLDVLWQRFVYDRES